MTGGRCSHAHLYTHRYIATRLHTSMTARSSAVTQNTQATLYSIYRSYKQCKMISLPRTWLLLVFIVMNSKLNTRIVGSDPTRGMDVRLRLFGVCVVLCSHWPCDELIPRPRSPIDCLFISFVISEIIPNGNGPDSLIRQGRGIRRSVGIGIIKRNAEHEVETTHKWKDAEMRVVRRRRSMIYHRLLGSWCWTSACRIHLSENESRIPKGDMWFL
jgi:hypothetical protein